MLENKKLSEILKEELAKPNPKGSSAREIALALIEQGKSGNVKAFETIRDTIGEKPTDNINAKIEPPTFVNDLK